MKLTLAKDFVEAGEMINIHVELRGSYSGRGMYGDNCAAIIIDNVLDLVPLSAAVARLFDAEVTDEEELFSQLENLKMDQMGRGYVIY